MIKILTVIGARPQIMKAAAISRAIKSKFSDCIEERILHTGQHYDANMSEMFSSELGIPQPEYNLNVGSGKHGEQTAKMIDKKENILIISGTIYPRLSPRAHRATELAKELARKGHNVTLAAKLGEYDYTEFEKEHNIRVENLGVSKFDYIVSEKENRKLSLWRKGVIFCLRKFFLFPDSLLQHRVVNYLADKKEIDRIITIAIPYAVHFGTRKARKKFPQIKKAKWISDCGDQLTYSKLFFYFKLILKKWERETDYIVLPTVKYKKFFSKEAQDKIIIIPQGFKMDYKLAEYKPNKVVTFAYSGLVYPNVRDPRKFLEYLSAQQRDFKFVVYTNKVKLFAPYIDKLKNKLELRNYVEHDKLIYELSKMDFLINIFHKGVAPSKMIDYTMTHRPILEIESEFKQGEIFEEFVRGDYSHAVVLEDFERFDISNVADNFLRL